MFSDIFTSFVLLCYYFVTQNLLCTLFVTTFANINKQRQLAWKLTSVKPTPEKGLKRTT